MTSWRTAKQARYYFIARKHSHKPWKAALLKVGFVHNHRVQECHVAGKWFAWESPSRTGRQVWCLDSVRVEVCVSVMHRRADLWGAFTDRGRQVWWRTHARTLTFFKSEALLYAVQKHNCKTWAKINLQLHTCTQLYTHRHTHMRTLTFLKSEAPLYGLHQLHPALQSSANILQGLTRDLRPNKWPYIFSRSCVCIECEQCACMCMCVCARVSWVCGSSNCTFRRGWNINPGEEACVLIQCPTPYSSAYRTEC